MLNIKKLTTRKDVMKNRKDGNKVANRSVSVSRAFYHGLLEDISVIIADGRRAVIRRINAAHVVVYWLIGRRIVEFYQQGKERAAYGDEVLKRLSADLKVKYGNGFSERNLEIMRLFYVDLKQGEFDHADAGQMNFYLNYIKENEVFPGENQPIGLILCANKDEVFAKYVLGSINNKIFASKYKLALPSEKEIGKRLRQHQ